MGFGGKKPAHMSPRRSPRIRARQLKFENNNNGDLDSKSVPEVLQKQSVFFYLAVIDSLVELVALGWTYYTSEKFFQGSRDYFDGTWFWIHAVSKSLIVPLYTINFILRSRTAAGKHVHPVVVAMVFSWLGDVVLLLAEKHTGMYFLIGLGLFLISHFQLIFIFMMHLGRMIPARPLLFFNLPYVVGLSYVYVKLSAGVPGDDMVMRAAVFAYAVTICFVGLCGAALFLKSYSWGSFFAGLGMQMFLFSDLTIGYDRFSKPFGLAPLTIMSTYICAIAFLLEGFHRIGERRAWKKKAEAEMRKRLERRHQLRISYKKAASIKHMVEMYTHISRQTLSGVKRVISMPNFRRPSVEEKED